MNPAAPRFSLALDGSATARGSVALGETTTTGGATVRWQTEFVAGRGQGGLLFAAVQTALREATAGGGTLGEIIVGLGPGSYSGVRQAIAACVGLSLATGAELFGVPSPIALETAATMTAYQTIGDARRGTFYYTAVENGVCVVGPELLPDRAALLARLAERPDWPVFADAPTPPEWGIAPAPIVALPLAGRLLTAPRAARTLPPLEPIYLRPFAVTPPNPAKTPGI